MTPTLLGTPLSLYSIPCLVLAILWIFIWPRGAAPPSGPRRLILRWGHAVVWFLLGMAALVGGTAVWGGQPTAGNLALASLGVYILFVIALVTAKRGR